MIGRPIRWTALLPVAAGLIVAAIDFAGLTGANFFWGALELICGVLAGTGLAALWMRENTTLQDRILSGILLICHILAERDPSGKTAMERYQEYLYQKMVWVLGVGALVELLLP